MRRRPLLSEIQTEETPQYIEALQPLYRRTVASSNALRFIPKIPNQTKGRAAVPTPLSLQQKADNRNKDPTARYCTCISGKPVTTLQPFEPCPITPSGPVPRHQPGDIVRAHQVSFPTAGKLENRGVTAIHRASILAKGPLKLPRTPFPGRSGGRALFSPAQSIWWLQWLQWLPGKAVCWSREGGRDRKGEHCNIFGREKGQRTSQKGRICEVSSDSQVTEY